ncbi:MAG: DUF2490 domain-containing protein [Lentimicrobiaceae bacterium]|jgi:hypothetical protein|nr:DUF2490 domain-containing protein [Lentimicrobiaceae bacterium]
MNKFIKIFIVITFFICRLHTLAQVNDAGAWMSINIEKSIFSDLSATFTEELRLNENCTEAGTILSDLGLAYKINKNIKISANYRFSNKRRLDDSYNNRHRYYFDIILKEKMKPIVFSVRSRFQSQYTDYNSSPDGRMPANYIREKATIKIDLDKKYTPYFYTEVYFRLNNVQYEQFNRIRYSGGFEYSFNRLHTIDIFYLIQKEYNKPNPRTDYIMGIGYFLYL